MKKDSIVIVFTGDGKGKTSAAIGTAIRALGAGRRVAFVQFIKTWAVSEHKFFADILQEPFLQDRLVFHRGGKGFFRAGEHSAKNVSDAEHRAAARQTLDFAKRCATSGDFDLVICDEINNAVHDGLLTADDLRELITLRKPTTSLCLTGRDFPKKLLELVDIATEMKKTKHHYDDGFLAQEGIDF
ncbi:cob(I)yrinic acid a,c-diamide adenosyltransferase [Candidatus Saccharibacteria bacterium]|nr:cob(I)yrinic acid a,c-diamide adenosyltransferase [Candidatus Saccharibacteria bacterium]